MADDDVQRPRRVRRAADDAHSATPPRVRHPGHAAAHLGPPAARGPADHPSGSPRSAGSPFHTGRSHAHRRLLAARHGHERTPRQQVGHPRVDAGAHGERHTAPLLVASTRRVHGRPAPGRIGPSHRRGHGSAPRTPLRADPQAGRKRPLPPRCPPAAPPPQMRRRHPPPRPSRHPRVRHRQPPRHPGDANTTPRPHVRPHPTST